MLASAPVSTKLEHRSLQAQSFMADIHAVSIVALDEDRFLLVRRGRAPSAGLYAFPGGRVERGETDEEAARRELNEETNLTAARLTALEHMTLEGDHGKRSRLAIFLAESLSGTLQASDDAASAGWYSLDEMRALPITPSTLSVATRLIDNARPLVVPPDSGKMSE